MTTTLWSISYSPWSDRARWALDHCGVTYTRRAYQPLLGEPAMRLKTGNWSRPVSVPVLETDDGVIADSLDISRYADRSAAEDVRLFPGEDQERILGLHARSEAALAGGRILGLRRILDTHRGALDAFVPPPLRSLPGNAGRSIAAAGVRRTIRKYANVTPKDAEGTLVEFLDVLAEAIEAGSRHDDGTLTLLPRFSFADITMATGLSFILPPSSHLRLSDASREAFTSPERPEGYDAVFAWRDALFAARA